MIEQRVREAALLALPRSLEALEPLQRQAIRLYFGLDGREHTMVEVSRALSTNVYAARAAVAWEVGAVAAALGVPGLLDDQELRLAQLMSNLLPFQP